MQTKLRTYEITPNDNICFPIGTILAVENLYEQLNFSSILGKHKTRVIDFNSLIKALLTYKLTENFSIDRAHKWINQDEVLEFFNLEKFNERVLYRTLQTLGSNKEEIILDIQDVLFSMYNFEHTNINMYWTSIVLYGDKSPLGKYGYSRELISLMRYEFKELKHTSTKFIKKSLSNLAVTVDFLKNKNKTYIYANFDSINRLILTQKQGIS